MRIFAYLQKMFMSSADSAVLYLFILGEYHIVSILLVPWPQNDIPPSGPSYKVGKVSTDHTRKVGKVDTDEDPPNMGDGPPPEFS